MTSKTYRVTKTGQFNLDITRLRSKIMRLDEFIIGLEEILSRNPRLGKPTKNKYLFAFKMKPLPGNPLLTAYYCYTNTEVTLWILRIDGEPKPDPPYIL